jgi:hypothetical protein
MKCAVHTEVDATGYCRNCGKPLCAECERNVRGALYCEDCLAAKMSNAPSAVPGTITTPGAVPPAPPAEQRSNHPGIALVLGFIPGLGAVFNGEYMKAVIHVLIFGSLIAANDSNVSGGFHALLGLATAAFYFYMPIDAYRVAKARQMGAPGPDPLPFFDSQGRRPTGAFILIGLGIFLLLSNLGVFDWDWWGKLWPVGLIALGAWILVGRAHQHQSGSGS